MLFAVIVLNHWEALVTKTNKEHILSIHNTIPYTIPYHTIMPLYQFNEHNYETQTILQ
jgi:hypothetical protein